MKAYQLLDRPEKWTQGWIAKDTTGSPCQPNDPRAARWCMVGAIALACGAAWRVTHRAIFNKVGPLDVWNDAPGRTWEEVVALLREVEGE